MNRVQNKAFEQTVGALLTRPRRPLLNAGVLHTPREEVMSPARAVSPAAHRGTRCLVSLRRARGNDRQEKQSWLSQLALGAGNAACHSTDESRQ